MYCDPQPINIPLFKPYVAKTVKAELEKVLYGGYITQGPQVDKFEAKLAAYIGVTPLTVNSCTSALQLAVHLAGGTDGDLVVTTPMTCSATVTAIKAMGGQIIWADINPNTGNIDPQSVNKILERYPKIKAIVVVHWAGYPCDLQAFYELGDHYDVSIIEDAAHAFGATYKNTKVGTHSDYVCFSFQAIKHLTTVDGGALVCKNEEDYKRAKLLRWFGIDREAPRVDNRIEQDIEEAGWKYHMNDVNATIGLENLKHIEWIVGQHQYHGKYLDEQLAGLPHITLLSKADDRESAYWVYTLRTDKRAELKTYLETKGIHSSQVHSRLDRHTAFQDALGGDHLPGLDEFSQSHLSIPCGWWLKQDELEYIAKTIQEWSQNNG